METAAATTWVLLIDTFLQPVTAERSEPEGNNSSKVKPHPHAVDTNSKAPCSAVGKYKTKKPKDLA